MLGFIVAALALPAPSPIPQQIPASACAPVPGTYAEAFGTQVEDRAALRFVRILETADQTARAAAIAGSRAATDAASVSAIADAAARIPCSESATALLTDRMVAAIDSTWNVGDDRDAASLSKRIELVAKALAARATLPSHVVDSVLAPFATTLDALSAPPSRPALCAKPNDDARTVRVTEPDYPGISGANGVTGKVFAKVELDSDGNVARVSVYKAELPDRDGAAEIREATIYAAGTSVYQPEIQHCVAVAGTYIFTAEFTARP